MVKSLHRESSIGNVFPPEWSLHSCCWVAWPAEPEYWNGHIQAAQREFVSLCAAISDGSHGAEKLRVLVRDEAQEREAKKSLGNIQADFEHMLYGDIWLRDTGPIFLIKNDEFLIAARFAFNGWGGKFLYPHDGTVARSISRRIGATQLVFPEILEGGALDVDGEGTCLVSADCLLNLNRNGAEYQSYLEKRLMQDIGVEKVIWIHGCLINDHTDGHVDNLVRFVAPQTVVCSFSEEDDDPNRSVYESILEQLINCRDAKEKKLNVQRVVSPGRVTDAAGEIMPASYLNFFIGNQKIIVPIFGKKSDELALQQIGALFPSRETVGLPANAILEGGGAFHCITLPQPAIPLVIP